MPVLAGVEAALHRFIEQPVDAVALAMRVFDEQYREQGKHIHYLPASLQYRAYAAANLDVEEARVAVRELMVARV